LARNVDLPGEPDETGTDGVILVVLDPPEFDLAFKAVSGARTRREAKTGRRRGTGAPTPT
jgi:hypothetical protein